VAFFVQLQPFTVPAVPPLQFSKSLRQAHTGIGRIARGQIMNKCSDNSNDFSKMPSGLLHTSKRHLIL
jgi:hypothetical protein